MNKMVKFINFNRFALLWIVLISILLSQCSTKKNTTVHRTYHNITAHYNAYFNGNESLKEGERKLETIEVDDYNQILALYKYGDQSMNKAIFPEMDNAILNNSLNVFSGIKLRSFFPKFVPIYTASISGSSKLYSLI